MLEKALRHGFPHFNAPLIRYESFVRNLFLVADYAVQIRAEMWKLLFENLVQLDVSLLCGFFFLFFCYK